MQASEETLQDFAAAVEQLAHRAFVGLPVTFIQTEAAHSFIDGLLGREEVTLWRPGTQPKSARLSLVGDVVIPA